MNDKILIERPTLNRQDTLMACFTEYLHGSTNRENRLTLRKQLLSDSDAEFTLLNQKEGMITDIGRFCRLFSNRYNVLIHLFDEHGREQVIGEKGVASVYIKKSKEGRFSLLRMEEDSDQQQHLFDLWIHPEPGKAINLTKLTPSIVPGFHTVSIVPEANVLYSIIPNGKLWRHVLTTPKHALYVFVDSLLVSVQVYNGKTNPYFYAPNGSGRTIQITVSLTPDGESTTCAEARFREFAALVGKRV